MGERPIRVKVPATTANLGPGFDCLGMALDLWNEARIEVSSGELAVSIQGQGANELPWDGGNLVYRSMERLFREADVSMPSLRLHCQNYIPIRRGLGSSAAAIVGGLVAANIILPRVAGQDVEPLSKERLLDLASELDGHPDNVAAALLGGLQLLAQEERALLSTPVPLPNEIHAVLYIPEIPISTEEARAVLPECVSREDAVYNIGRVALLVNSLATGNLGNLRFGLMDRLHQPYRQRLFPPMKVIFKAALDAGALGVFLSGSGSTILALTKGQEMTVAYEMAEAGRKAGLQGDVKITVPTAQGAHQIED